MTEAEFIEEVRAAMRKAPSPRDAAHRVHAVCRKAATAWGMKPDIEVSLRSPVASKAHGGQRNWHVSFEAGPHDWAVEASMGSGGKVWAEPYWGFDLYFHQTEVRS